MKTTWIRSSAVILLTIILTIGMQAQPRGGRGQGQGYGQGQGRGMGPCMTGTGVAGKGVAGTFACLNLSEEQEAELSELRLAHYKIMNPLRNQQAELRLKKRNLMTESDVNLEEINEIIDEQTELSARIQKLNAAHRLETRSVLTEEQRMIMDQQRRRPYARYGKGRGQNSGYGRPGPCRI